MSRIPNKNTTPERVVRSALHRMGFRFRLHRSDLPGKPDIALPKHRTVVFVHGCFWHRHAGCRYSYTPKTRTAFWMQKFRCNVQRDRAVLRALRQLGWRVLTVWECQTHESDQLRGRLERLMERG